MNDGNLLIDRLSPDDRSALLQAAPAFDFALGHEFCEPGDAVTHVDFVERGMISVVTVMQDGRSVESSMIGREGVTHPLAFQHAPPCHARLVAQLKGGSRRIELSRLRVLADQRPGLRTVLCAYAGDLIGELEQSTACNALHRADQRFAKWLLRCHDRADDDRLQLTQEFLANMLGAQRTTVNEAAQQLQRQGAIEYSRGVVRIVDRVALERAACECYGVSHRALDASAASRDPVRA